MDSQLQAGVRRNSYRSTVLQDPHRITAFKGLCMYTNWLVKDRREGATMCPKWQAHTRVGLWPLASTRVRPIRPTRGWGLIASATSLPMKGTVTSGIVKNTQPLKIANFLFGSDMMESKHFPLSFLFPLCAKKKVR